MSETQRKRTRLIRSGLALAVAAPLAAPVQAQYEVRYGIGLEQDDNIFLSEEDTEDDTVVTNTLGVRYVQDSPALEADVEGQARHLHYVDDTADDETLTDLSATATWRILPDQLHLFAQDEAAEVRSSARDRGSPATTQSANSYVVGPDLIFGSGTVNRITVSARAGEAYFENGTDSERAAIGARWARQISAVSEISARVQRQEVTYTEPDPVAEDFERDDVFVGWSRELRSRQIDVELGAFEIRREDDSLDELDGGQGVLQLTQFVGVTTSFTIRGERAVEDAGARLLSATDSAVSLAGTDAIVTGDLVERTDIELGVNRRGPDYQLRASLIASEEDFEQAPEDIEATGARVALDYFLGPRSTVFLALAGSTQEFTQSDREDDDATLRVAYQRGLTRSLDLDLRYDYVERRSNVDGESFEANRVGAFLTYRWGPGFED